MNNETNLQDQSVLNKQNQEKLNAKQLNQSIGSQEKENFTTFSGSNFTINPVNQGQQKNNQEQNSQNSDSSLLYAAEGDKEDQAYIVNNILSDEKELSPEEAQEAVRKAQEKANNARERVRGMEGEIVKVVEKAKKARDAYNKSKRAYEDISQPEAKKAKIRIQMAKRTYENAEKAFEKAKKEVNDVQVRFNDLAREVKEADAQLVVAQTKSMAVTLKHAKEHANELGESTIIKNRLEASEDVLQQMQATGAKMMAEVEQSKNKDIADQTNSINNKTQQEELQEKIDEAQQKVEEKTKELEEIQIKGEEAQREADKAQLEVTKAQLEVDKAIAKFEQQPESEEAKKELDKAQNKLDEMQDEAEIAQIRVGEIMERSEEIRQELVKAQDQLTTIEFEKIQKEAEQNDELNNDINEKDLTLSGPDDQTQDEKVSNLTTTVRSSLDKSLPKVEQQYEKVQQNLNRELVKNEDIQDMVQNGLDEELDRNITEKDVQNVIDDVNEQDTDINNLALSNQDNDDDLEKRYQQLVDEVETERLEKEKQQVQQQNEQLQNVDTNIQQNQDIKDKDLMLSAVDKDDKTQTNNLQSQIRSSANNPGNNPGSNPEKDQIYFNDNIVEGLTNDSEITNVLNENNSDIQEITDRINTLIDQANNKEDTKIEEINALKDRLDTLDKNISLQTNQLDSQRAQNSADVERGEEYLEGLIDQLQKIKGEIKEREETVENLENENSENKKALLEAKNGQSKLDESKANIESQIQATETGNNDNDATRKKLKDGIDRRLIDISILENDIKNLEKQKQDPEKIPNNEFTFVNPGEEPDKVNGHLTEEQAKEEIKKLGGEPQLPEGIDENIRRLEEEIRNLNGQINDKLEDPGNFVDGEFVPKKYEEKEPTPIEKADMPDGEEITENPGEPIPEPEFQEINFNELFESFEMDKVLNKLKDGSRMFNSYYNQADPKQTYTSNAEIKKARKIVEEKLENYFSDINENTLGRLKEFIKNSEMDPKHPKKFNPFIMSKENGKWEKDYLDSIPALYRDLKGPRNSKFNSAKNKLFSAVTYALIQGEQKRLKNGLDRNEAADIINDGLSGVYNREQEGQYNANLDTIRRHNQKVAKYQAWEKWRQWNKYQTDLEKYNQEKKQFEEEQKRLEKEFNQNKDKQRKQHEAAVQEFKANQEKNQANKQQLENKKTELDNYKKQKDNYKTSKAEYDQQVKAINDKLKESQQYDRDLKTYNEKVKQQTAHENEQARIDGIKNSNAEIAQSNAGIDKQIGEKQKEIDGLRNDIARLNDELGNIQGNNNENNNLINDLRNSLSNINQQITDSKSNLDNIKDSINSINEQIIEKKKEIEQFKNDEVNNILAKIEEIAGQNVMDTIAKQFENDTIDKKIARNLGENDGVLGNVKHSQLDELEQTKSLRDKLQGLEERLKSKNKPLQRETRSQSIINKQSKNDFGKGKGETYNGENVNKQNNNKYEKETIQMDCPVEKDGRFANEIYKYQDTILFNDKNYKVKNVQNNEDINLYEAGSKILSIYMKNNKDLFSLEGFRKELESRTVLYDDEGKVKPKPYKGEDLDLFNETVSNTYRAGIEQYAYLNRENEAFSEVKKELEESFGKYKDKKPVTEEEIAAENSRQRKIERCIESHLVQSRTLQSLLAKIAEKNDKLMEFTVAEQEIKQDPLLKTDMDNEDRQIPKSSKLQDGVDVYSKAINGKEFKIVNNDVKDKKELAEKFAQVYDQCLGEIEGYKNRDFYKLSDNEIKGLVQLKLRDSIIINGKFDKKDKEKFNGIKDTIIGSIEENALKNDKVKARFANIQTIREQIRQEEVARQQQEKQERERQEKKNDIVEEIKKTKKQKERQR